jgi:hypothetical protein
MERNWSRIEKLIKRSTIGFSKPTAGRERALVPGEIPISDTKARLRAAGRHRGRVTEKTGRALNWAGYGVMGASMLLFVLAGLWR